MKLHLTIPLIALVLLSACGGESNTASEEKDSTETKLPFVNTITVAKSDFQNFIEVQGVVEADKNVTLTAEMGGLIRSINIEEGQHVNAGQTLVVLDADVITKSIEEVEKSLELANYLFEKQSNLWKQNIGSELQYTQAKNNKERLEESLETLKAQRAMSVITAPFSGYIDKIFPHVGEMAAPQVPVIRLMDLKKVHITGDVVETYLKSVSVGKSVDVYCRALDTTFKNLSITRVGKYINPTNRTFSITVDMGNNNEILLPNLVTILRIKHDVIKDAITVPNSSLLQSSSGANYVYALRKEGDKEIVYKIDVISGPSDDNSTVILPNPSAKEELTVGTRVITVGARGVKPGMEVKVK